MSTTSDAADTDQRARQDTSAASLAGAPSPGEGGPRCTCGAWYAPPEARRRCAPGCPASETAGAVRLQSADPVAIVTHEKLTTVGKAELCFAFLLEAGIHAHAGIAKCWTVRGPAPYALAEGGPQGGESEVVCLKIALDVYSGNGASSLPRVLQLILPDPRQGGALLHLLQALHDGDLAQVWYVNKVIAEHLKDAENPVPWAQAVGLPIVVRWGGPQ